MSGDVIKVGQASKFRVIKVNQEERKLGLSLKALKEKPVDLGKEAVEGGAFPKERKAREPREPRMSKEDMPMRTKETTPVKNALQQALEEHAAKIKNAKDE